MDIKELKILARCILGSFAVYHSWRWLRFRLVQGYADLVPVGRISEIYVYPVKSFRGTKVFSVFCDWLGPTTVGGAVDRQFLVVDGETGRFYTARQEPSMVLVSATVERGQLSLCKDDARVSVDLEAIHNRGKVVRATLHDKLCADGLDCGDEVATWIDDVIGRKGTRLLMFERGLYNERFCEADGKRYQTAFADDAPYMMASNASLNDLNSHLHISVTQRNFRPNLVIEWSEPWEENNWKRIRIGNQAEFHCIRPCERCILTTVHPEEGVRSKTREPLATLKRLCGSKMVPSPPCFGVDMGLIRRGHVCVGDVVWAERKQ